ncbi:serine/threonine-protein kinase PCRK1-like [Bidens hawaiensis]|uniref:serine/threonine-protein kinase PCRK1-like n=1 Tax=Bidens hawaiensis TaxID=980011 RepID=UPI00404972E7
MVFSFRCFSFSFGEEIEYETRIETKTTSTDTFYTASSNFNGHITDSQASDLQILAGKPSKLRVFTVAELKFATRNFSTSSKIGEGGFGSVYRGVVKSLDHPFNEIQIAVKLANGGLQGHKQWVTEVNVLGQIEHPNLVKLIGYCAEDDEDRTHRLLVYEYMLNGSLADWLSSGSVAPLSWPMRLKVARDAACALAYLHQQTPTPIIFRDFKPSNILLDDEWNAKLSDFGFARLGPLDGHTHVTTRVVGTYGYADPEYSLTGHLRTDCDVWSYGVFLYVLITGKPPINLNLPKDEQHLLEWLKPFLRHGKFRLIVDPRIKGQFPLQSAKELATIAETCLLRNRNMRPKMSRVFNMLNELITDSLLETIPPFVSVVDRERVSDRWKVSHEQQSSTIVKVKRKRMFVCLPHLGYSKK